MQKIYISLILSTCIFQLYPLCPQVLDDIQKYIKEDEQGLIILKSSLERMHHDQGMTPLLNLPVWLDYIRKTSPYVFLVLHDDHYYVTSSKDSELLYEVYEGDHNLTFDGDILWGYDLAGNLFKATPRGERAHTHNHNCERIFGLVATH